MKTYSTIGIISTVGLLSTLVIAASRPLPAKRFVNAENVGEAQFRQQVQPLLKTYCYGCHSGDVKSGNVVLDQPHSYEALLQNRTLFRKVLMNIRSGTMPPSDMPQPTATEKARIEQWIKSQVYQIDPADPDPGRVTVRRLNRVEYRNTIRDLLGIDYDTQAEFPADDAGHGFDNIGDVLTISPMLLEKYVNAAQAIVSQAVPMTSRVVPEREIPGIEFAVGGTNAPVDKTITYRALSYYEPGTATHSFSVTEAGDYKIVLDLSANERYVDNVFDYNRCRVICRADGEELFRREFNREGGKKFHLEFDRKWSAGEHTISFDVEPLTPAKEQIRSLAFRINKVTIRGPFDPKSMVEPRRYRTFFPKPVPENAADRRSYARTLLGDFGKRAFRRPVDDPTLARLVDLAEGVYRQPGQTFEAGVAQAMVAILASPRFLFREEGTAPGQERLAHPLIDEYALASRLSYFLWSSMPDEELFRLAAQGTLRKNLPAQVQRMLHDSRSSALVQNFSGQWLQTRDIERIPINPRAVLAREIDPATAPPVNPAGAGRPPGNRPRILFDEPLRKALHSEADLYFRHIIDEDRSVLELLNSDYTFLNARLAQFYGLADLGVTGEEFRKVTLPADSPRGGVLTMGSVLAVTSNPTRTSPVKRGLFILDNIIGAPAPPPPPNIPPLEDAAAKVKDRKPTLREVLSAHRDKVECSSCHKRLDPPGLALENFNALGLWRNQEFGQPVEPAGTLVTGESFKDIRELKQILVSRHSTEFYRCLTQKLLTYAIGRGLEDDDVESVDRIVQRMERDRGRFSTVLMGVIESAPFQKCRNPSAGNDKMAPTKGTPVAKSKVAVR